MLTNEKKILLIAEACHEANRVYCKALGDDSQVNWNETPQNIKDSAIEGVKFHLLNPHVHHSASHENWLRFKEADGWRHGSVKDAKKKTHPCFVPFDQLPPEQQKKDRLFQETVRTMLNMLALPDFHGQPKCDMTVLERARLGGHKY